MSSPVTTPHSPGGSDGSERLPAPAAAPASGVVNGRAWTVVVVGAMALWTVTLFVVVREAFLGFRLGRFDLGNMVQAVWSTTQGRPLDMTDGATGEQMSRLGAHVDPFLVLLAPLWAVWPSPLALALAQIAVVSLGALPVFWLARRRLGSERAGGILALAYLAYPWLAWSALGAIHPVTFAIPLYLFCIWFLETDRLVPFGVCAALAATTGELMGLPVAGLGIWFALARGQRKAGSIIALAGAAWTVVAVLVVVPAARGESSMYYGFYDEVGGSPQGVVRTLLTDPGAVIGALVEAHDLVYLVWLGLPLAGLFLLAPGLAAVAIPQLLANSLSDFRSMTDPRYHSVAAVIPFLIAATALGIARLRPELRTRAAGLVLVLSTVLALAVGPWSRVVGITPLGGREPLPAERIEALRDAVALVPEGAPASSSNSTGAHLSARRLVYSVPVLGEAEWVVVDTSDPWVTSADSPILTRRPAVVRGLVRSLERDPRWVTVLAREGVLVFRRVGD